MNDIEDIKNNYDKSFFDILKSYLKILSFIVLVVAFGIYIGDMLFGNRSLDVMLALEQKKESLIKKTAKLKKENALLQKEYFELKQLDSDVK